MDDYIDQLLKKSQKMREYAENQGNDIQKDLSYIDLNNITQTPDVQLIKSQEFQTKKPPQLDYSRKLTSDIIQRKSMQIMQQEKKFQELEEQSGNKKIKQRQTMNVSSQSPIIKEIVRKSLATSLLSNTQQNNLNQKQVTVTDSQSSDDDQDESLNQNQQLELSRQIENLKVIKEQTKLRNQELKVQNQVLENDKLIIQEKEAQLRKQLQTSSNQLNGLTQEFENLQFERDEAQKVKEQKLKLIETISQQNIAQINMLTQAIKEQELEGQSLLNSQNTFIDFKQENQKLKEQLAQKSQDLQNEISRIKRLEEESYGLNKENEILRLKNRKSNGFCC